VPTPITTKQQFVREYKKGTFGNAAPTWNSIVTLEESGYKGLVHLRSREPGGVGYYNLEVDEALHRWWRKGSKEWYCSGMAPHYCGTIQGELQLTDKGLWLEYNLLQLPMRDAFAQQRLTAKGIMASTLIKQFMFPNSYDWLQVLLEQYHDHIIEFSCFAIPWGTIPHENTIWWECRRY
jgi:hypothetical protein